MNVLVGPNGGGKSNFLSIFRFLGEVARTDLVPAISRLFGDYKRLICGSSTANITAGVRISIKGEISQYSSPTALDEYSLAFRQMIPVRGRAVFRRQEQILLKRGAGRGRRITLGGTKYEFETVGVSGGTKGRPNSESAIRQDVSGQIGQDASALSVLRRIGERNDTEQVGQLAEVFEDLRLFDPDVDRVRRTVRSEESEHLRPDASNLASVLKYLEEAEPDVFKAVQDDMRYVLPGFQRLEFSRLDADAEEIRIGVRERGLREVTPLRFASFGTVRALALFTMLRDPNPPRLTCLEEVDHGLHPHALDVLVERLRDASVRSQIILATHSPALVNRIAAEELIVFERDADTGVTNVPTLDPKIIGRMEQESDFRLGELWYSGLLGGARK